MALTRSCSLHTNLLAPIDLQRGQYEDIDQAERLMGCSPPRFLRLASRLERFEISVPPALLPAYWKLLQRLQPVHGA